MGIKVNTIETAPRESKQTLENVKKAFGFVPNLFGVFSHSPETAEAYLKVSELFESSSLSPTEQQIVLLSASVENECDYCVAAHTVVAGMQKVPAEIVEAIREGSGIANTKLEALRNFATELTVKRGVVSETVAENFFKAGYSEKNALEVILGITQKTLSNYVNHLADTPLDQAFASAEWQPAGRKAASA